MKREEIIKEAEKYFNANKESVKCKFDENWLRNVCSKLMADFLIQQIGKEQPKKKVAFIGEPPLAMRALLEMESEPQQPDTEVEKPDFEEMKKDFAENPEYAAMKYGEEQAVEDKFLFKGEYYFTHSYIKSMQEKHESQKQQWDRERGELVECIKSLVSRFDIEENQKFIKAGYLFSKAKELLNKYQ